MADTTTLHCINSTIVKLGKLTVVQKVYRGISGGVLPDEFWEPNEFKVPPRTHSSSFHSLALRQQPPSPQQAIPGSNF